MTAATAKVCSNQFHDTDICGCGEPKRASHQRCKKCRQTASRNAHLDEIRSKDRIRKKVTVLSFLRVVPINRLQREFSEREIVKHFGGPPPETAWFRFTDAPKDAEDGTARISITSRPQVASALKPWKDGFLPETECELLLNERTRLIPAYEKGVPVDMSQESDEVKQWHLRREKDEKEGD